MSLTEPQRRAALEMRANRMSTFDISMALALPRSDLTRLFMEIDCRTQDRARTSKLRAGDLGYEDIHAEAVKETEAHKKAAEKWHKRMGAARWNCKRTDWQG